MNYDTRDHVVYCCNGSYFEFNWHMYDSYTGSDYRYMEYILDLRHYLQLTQNGIFAIQGTFTRIAGNAPIQAYPVLGDDRLRNTVWDYGKISVLHFLRVWEMWLTISIILIAQN